MSRLVLAAALGLCWAGSSFAQCRQWVPWPPYGPVYVTPSVFWGTPAPKPLPPAPMPAPFAPKPGVGVREEEPVPSKPPDKSKAKEGDTKEKEPPRIPKVQLPLPDDPDDPGTRAKKSEPKKDQKEPLADVDKTVEQFLILSESKKAERPADVKVGFFNHSDRDLDLDVNGEPLKLPSGQYVTVRVKRTFKWGEKGKKSMDVVVPPDADGIEIVFRK